MFTEFPYPVAEADARGRMEEDASPLALALHVAAGHVDAFDQAAALDHVTKAQTQELRDPEARAHPEKEERPRRAGIRPPACDLDKPLFFNNFLC